MDSKKYQQGCLRTETPNKPIRVPAANPVFSDTSELPHDEGDGQPFIPTHLIINRLVHGAWIAQREGSELLDGILAGPFYNKTIDVLNIKEEVGDVLYGLALVCEAVGTTLEAEMARNQQKLAKRYPDKFTTEAYLGRDVEAERSAMQPLETDGVDPVPPAPRQLVAVTDPHGNTLGEPAWGSGLTNEDFEQFHAGISARVPINESYVRHRDAGFHPKALIVTNVTFDKLVVEGWSPGIIPTYQGIPVIRKQHITNNLPFKFRFL